MPGRAAYGAAWIVDLADNARVNAIPGNPPRVIVEWNSAQKSQCTTNYLIASRHRGK